MLKREKEARQDKEYLCRMKIYDAERYNANTTLYDYVSMLNERSSIGGHNKHVQPLSTHSVYDPSFGVYKGFVGTSSVLKKMERLMMMIMLATCLTLHRLGRAWVHNSSLKFQCI